MGHEVKLLVDTCTFIWLCAEPARLSQRAKTALQDRDGGVLLSEVSIMEICFKVTSGKLILPDPPSVWVENQIDIWKFDILTLSRSTMYRAGELPIHHRDPFDRLLIAHAIEGRATVLTPDTEYKKYAVSVLW